MLGKALRVIGRVHLVIALLLLAVVFCDPTARRYGDRIQVALPLLAWGCAALDKSGSEFAARFFGMLFVAHGSKFALGDAEINQRPSGGDKGFPSAHTASAAIGASSLVTDCISAHPGAKAVVVFAAAFVGASRIEAEKHNIWQVLAGGLLGWGADRMLRRGRARQAAQEAFMFAKQWIRANLVSIRATRRLQKAAAASVVAALLLAGSIGIARAEVQLSFYGGFQTAPHSIITDSVLGDARVRWLGKSFEAPPYYGVRATWWGSEEWGFGAEINHAKVYAENPGAIGYDVLEFTDGLNLITANVFRRFPNAGRFTPYVGGGLGIAVPHVEIQRSGEGRTFEYQLTGPAAILVVGTSYEINDRWSVFGEYKGSYSSNKAKVDAGGTLTTNIITNALNLGVSFNF
jgi:lipid A oxidase